MQRQHNRRFAVMSFNSVHDAHRRAAIQTQQAIAKESRDNNKKDNKKHFNVDDTTRVVKADTWVERLKQSYLKNSRHANIK